MRERGERVWPSSFFFSVFFLSTKFQKRKEKITHLVDQHGLVRIHLDGVADVARQVLVRVDDLHGAASEHERGADLFFCREWVKNFFFKFEKERKKTSAFFQKKNLSYHHRVPQRVRGLERRLLRGDHSPGWLLDLQLLQQLVPQVPVLGRVDRFRLRAPDFNQTVARSCRDRVGLEVLGERGGELERGLPSELDDDAVGAALFDDVENVLNWGWRFGGGRGRRGKKKKKEECEFFRVSSFEFFLLLFSWSFFFLSAPTLPSLSLPLSTLLTGQRLEVQPRRRVVVRGDGLGVRVHHDGLEALVAQRERGVAAAVVELDPLADAVGTPAEDEHCWLVGGEGGRGEERGEVVNERRKRN